VSWPLPHLQAGLAVLCAISFGACCPINAQNTREEIVLELLALSAPVVIVAAQDDAGAGASGGGMTESLSDALAAAGIVVVELRQDTSTAGLFSIRLGLKSGAQQLQRQKSLREAPMAPKLVRTATRTMGRARHAWVLLLHTSGTSGKKKVVPYSLETLAVGSACVAASWGLGPADICLNMMPLFHTGGIVRNLLAPILVGSATVCCPGFDPSLFWDKVPTLGATWYYGAPTMHSLILAEASRRGGAPAHTVRLIGNAAGPLLPSLARQLRDVFGEATAVLPSYGMTECMPITAPPLDYNVADKVGTSGRAVGPQLSIRDGAGKEMPAGSIGNITLRGPPTFGGYEDPEVRRFLIRSARSAR